MDQFDDLPDIIEKDTKPKFQTEVHNNGDAAGTSGPYDNGLKPLFEEESTMTQMGYKDPDDADAPDKHAQNATSHDEQ